MNPEDTSKKFKFEPTLENFLNLRRIAPEIEFDVSFLSGMEAPYVLEAFLSSYGIPVELFIGVLDANDAAIQKMSMIILEDMFQEEILQKDGATHIAARRLVMPQHLRDWLTCSMLGALSWNDDRYICTNLIALLHFRLLGGTSRIEEMIDIHSKKQRACYCGASLKARGKTVSFRAVAKMLGVQASTVKRWFTSEHEFQDQANRLASAFHPDGSLKSLREMDFGLLRRE